MSIWKRKLTIIMLMYAHMCVLALFLVLGDVSFPPSFNVPPFLNC